MRFSHSRRGVLAIKPEALATMRAFEQHGSEATEAGGLLLGRYIRDGYDIIVDRVTVPMLGDTRTRYTFDRESPGHQRAIDEAWESSGGTCCYLGDWHTHAEPFPRPSSVDLDNWRHLLRDEIVEDQACFFLIVGQREIRAWEGNRRTGEITKLSRLDADAFQGAA